MPKIALVGRPNVGKSALFNRICKKRIAIVDEAEGVTRDRNYAKADVFGKEITIIDTGGIDPTGTVVHNEEIRRQAEIAIEEADSIILVVDGQVGPTPLDEYVARQLLRGGKKVCLAVNKIDDLSQNYRVHEFHKLGIEEMVGVSASQGYHVAEILEAATKGFLDSDFEEKALYNGPKIAIVGRPNVGKSTFVNALLKEERCVVSPIAGTTRDCVDISLKVGSKEYTLIDTAGIRRKNREHEVVDKFAAIRTENAIEKADICVLMLDAEQGITAQEKRIAQILESEGKGCIILLNKWDLVKGFRMEHCLKGIQEEASFLSHCPTYFISAKTNRNFSQVFPAIDKVAENMEKRVTTGQLNKFLEKAIQQYHPPMIQGKRLRIFYMAQVEVHPPKFVLFVNKPELMTDTYKKYLEHQFRKAYGFEGVPLQLMLKKREDRGFHPSRAKEKTYEESHSFAVIE